MSAFVVVADHPYHSVTDAYGAYEIRDLPAGRYAVHVWHEELGTLAEEVRIEAGGTAKADFTFAARPGEPEAR